MTDTGNDQLDRIEKLMNQHIRASAAGRVSMQSQIDGVSAKTNDALSVTTEIKSTVKGLSLLGKVSAWIGSLAIAAGAVVGLWQLLSPGIGP